MLEYVSLVTSREPPGITAPPLAAPGPEVVANNAARAVVRAAAGGGGGGGGDADWAGVGAGEEADADDDPGGGARGRH